jgi:hypothetical protein
MEMEVRVRMKDGRMRRRNGTIRSKSKVQVTRGRRTRKPVIEWIKHELNIFV